MGDVRVFEGWSIRLVKRACFGLLGSPSKSRRDLLDLGWGFGGMVVFCYVDSHRFFLLVC